MRWAYSAADAAPAGPVRTSGRRVGALDSAAFLLERGEVVEAAAPVEEAIVDFVFETFLGLPDETAVEVIESGLCLTGGGALLSRLVKSIGWKTGLHVRVPPDPMHAVINGALALLPHATLAGLWRE